MLSLITSFLKTGAILLLAMSPLWVIGWSLEATVCEPPFLVVYAGVFLLGAPSRILVLIDIVLV